LRLFIAINIDASIRDVLMDTVGVLKDLGVRGSFTLKENLHLTLIFVGETDRKADVCSAIDGAIDPWDGEAFDLTLEGLGVFRREGGDILWAGIKSGELLYDLQSRLKESLLDAGFRIENRKYKPHLTLGRKVVLHDKMKKGDLVSLMPKVKQRVEHISLMKSERIGGKLIYTEIYRKELRISQLSFDEKDDG
jgi:2'-5' RNA ligase